MPLKLPMFIECAPDDPTGGMVKDKAESFGSVSEKVWLQKDETDGMERIR